MMIGQLATDILRPQQMEDTLEATIGAMMEAKVDEMVERNRNKYRNGTRMRLIDGKFQDDDDDDDDYDDKDDWNDVEDNDYDNNRDNDDEDHSDDNYKDESRCSIASYDDDNVDEGNDGTMMMMLYIGCIWKMMPLWTQNLMIMLSVMD